MQRTALLMGMLLSLFTATAQPTPPTKKVMALGVFHFAYPNLDAVQTSETNQVSVLEEPYQAEIKKIAMALAEFRPTVIAVEFTPDAQPRVDSLYALYRAGRWELKKNEVYQLGFRLGKLLDLDRIHCVDDPGRHYPQIESLLRDSTRLSRFEQYYLHPPDSLRRKPAETKKVSSIITTLLETNDPVKARESLGTYLDHPFRYEETPGDFTGVDFETGRWFNRNLRIYRNLQRHATAPEERVLLLIGSAHLNLLNYFLEADSEFELVSPLPYLQKASEWKLAKSK